MRAKKVYEAFTEDSDPIEDLGIGQRAIIKKWFDTWAPDAEYTIGNNLNVIVRGSLYLQGTNVTELPENLSVERCLDLQRTKITELPENLSVEGYLDLEGTKISKLPKSLKVKESIIHKFLKK